VDPLGNELDVDRVEIELEVALDLHVAVGLAGDDALEAVPQEAALGDEQHRPGEHQQAKQGGDGGDDAGERGAERARRRRRGVTRRGRRVGGGYRDVAIGHRGRESPAGGRSSAGVQTPVALHHALG
jgi:hypothetical protein